MCKICENGTIPIAKASYKGQNAVVRLDLECNQIDCQVIDDNGFGAWSDNALDILFCPVCGKKLPEVE